MEALSGSTYGVVRFSLPGCVVASYVSILTLQNQMEMKVQDIDDNNNR